MGLNLQRVELRNIRSHSHIIFEPENSGVTAIKGENGTGKSSIVDSIAWCLFGTKPNGVSKATEIFKNGIGEKDPAYVRVDMVVDGRSLRFERRRVNRHGAIEVEVFEADSAAGSVSRFKNVAGPAISHAESYIKKLLGMDEKGFLAAILIQQKQVDQLISASPRERGQVIEKLTGIAGITAALTESKQELNVLKKSAALSTIDEAGLEKLKEEYAEIKNSIEQKKRKLEETKAQLFQVKEDGSSAREKHDSALKLFEHRDVLEKELRELALKKTLKEEDLSETLVEKEAVKKEIVGFGSDLSEELLKLIEEKESEHNQLESVRIRSVDSIASLSLEKKNLEQKQIELSEVSGEISEVSEQLLRQEESLKELNDSFFSLQADLQQLENATSVIEHGDSCPTCLQKVSNVSAATKALNKLSEKSKIQMKKVESEISTLLSQIEQSSRLKENLILKQQNELRIVEITKELKQIKKSLDGAQGELRIVNKELTVLRSRLDEARSANQKKDFHQKLLTKAQKLTSEIEEIDFRSSQVKKELASLGGASQKEIAVLAKRLEELRQKHTKLSLEYTTLSGEVKLSIQKIEHLKEDISRHTDDISRHNSLIQSVAVASHTQEVISEFRENRIKTSIPVIEIYASDLLNRFTEGKFSRITLNEKFEATVYLSDGTPRSVGLLSGGELSAAAMALRLAISMLLNSDSGQNLIILDEVLVSQDVNRAEQILTTLKDVAKGQVVLIAHNEAIDSIADKIVVLGGPTEVLENQSEEVEVKENV